MWGILNFLKSICEIFADPWNFIYEAFVLEIAKPSNCLQHDGVWDENYTLNNSPVFVVPIFILGRKILQVQEFGDKFLDDRPPIYLEPQIAGRYKTFRLFRKAIMGQITRKNWMSSISFLLFSFVFWINNIGVTRKLYKFNWNENKFLVTH